MPDDVPCHICSKFIGKNLPKHHTRNTNANVSLGKMFNCKDFSLHEKIQTWVNIFDLVNLI